MSRGVILPIDVIHVILQMFQLPEDAKTLGSCARACKLWLPVARKYLFADLVLIHPASLDDAPNHRYDLEWHGVLKPVTADLIFARRLEVISYGRTSVLEVLHRVVPSLPLIQHIRLMGGRLFSLPHLPDIPLCPSSIDSLELPQIVCSARGFVNLIKVICPRRDLSIAGPYLAFMLDGDREDGSLPATAFNVETSVRSLRLALNDFSYPGLVAPVDNFISLCAPKAVRHLALDLYDDGGFHASFVQFLHKAQCLEVLEFRRSTRYDQAIRRRIENDLGSALRDMYTLKTLILGFPVEFLPPDYTKPHQSISIYASSPSCPSRCRTSSAISARQVSNWTGKSGISRWGDSPIFAPARWRQRWQTS